MQIKPVNPFFSEGDLKSSLIFFFIASIPSSQTKRPFVCLPVWRWRVDWTRPCGPGSVAAKWPGRWWCRRWWGRRRRSRRPRSSTCWSSWAAATGAGGCAGWGGRVRARPRGCPAAGWPAGAAAWGRRTTATAPSTASPVWARSPGAAPGGCRVSNGHL